jgi:hypothetical protein
MDVSQTIHKTIALLFPPQLSPTHRSKNNRGIIPTPSVDNSPRPPPQSNHHPSDADKRRAQSHIIAQQRPGAEVNTSTLIHDLSLHARARTQHTRTDSLLSSFLSISDHHGGDTLVTPQYQRSRGKRKRKGRGWDGQKLGGRKESGGEKPNPSARGNLGK